MAAVGAASAQSSVTLYGIIDAGFGHTRTKTTYSHGVTKVKRSTGFMSNGMSSSRWGLKGQEDLGNGLAAVFNVEAGFDAVTGSASGGFLRRSVVGLKGGFGQVLIGTDYTPVDSVSNYLAVDLLDTGDFYTGRATGIHYSGNFSGVSVAAVAGYNRNKTSMGDVTTKDVRKNLYGLGLGYQTGPFSIYGAVQVDETKELGLEKKKTTEYAVGASYDFTSAKLFAHYVAKEPRKQKAKQQFGLGVTVPMGAFELGAQYAYNNDREDKSKGHNFGLRGGYSLSKRTNLYAQYARHNAWKHKDSGSKTYTDSFMMGVRHKF